MNTPTTGNNDEDTLLLMLLAAAFVAVGGVPLVLGTVLPEVRSWLLEHGILLPADQAQLVLPGAGAGLDFLRIVIAGGLLCSGVALAAFRARRRRSSR